MVVECCFLLNQILYGARPEQIQDLAKLVGYKITDVSYSSPGKFIS